MIGKCERVQIRLYQFWGTFFLAIVLLAYVVAKA